MNFPLPPVGEGLYEVELVRWLVRPGDPVARGQGLAEVMSDKATMEVPAPFAGTVTDVAVAPGTKVKVGQVILTYAPAGEPVAVVASGTPPLPERSENGRSAPFPVPDRNGATKPDALSEHNPATGPAATHGASAPGRLPPAAPSVRLLARKLGVDLASVPGSGPHGRILLNDLTPFLTPSRPGVRE